MLSKQPVPTFVAQLVKAFAKITGLDTCAWSLTQTEHGSFWLPLESTLKEPPKGDWPALAAWPSRVKKGEPFWGVKGNKTPSNGGCRDCEVRSTCTVLAEVAYPVRVGGEVRGAVVALATTSAALRLVLQSDKSDVFALLEALSITLASRWPTPRQGRRLRAPLRPSARRPDARDGPEVEPLPTELIKGDSPALKRLKGMAAAAARTDSTVLILGETGVGKELFAMAVHAESRRRRGPLIAVNCAAIPENLIESELFGYEGGAFTGAKPGGKPGKFELASGGTIFLDEIGDLPMHVQAKLLRVLEERRVERIGGLRRIPVDVRIIAATNHDLAAMVKAHEFREDLFYRLNVIPLVIPPLRYHKDDLDALLGYFLKENAGAAARSGGFTVPSRFSRESLAMLYAYDWPGNIREVRNVVEYAVSMAVDGDEITPQDLPPYVLGRSAGQAWEKPRGPETGGAERLAQLEDEAIRAALAKYGTTAAGKKAAAAALGISRATLYRRLKKMQSGFSV